MTQPSATATTAATGVARINAPLPAFYDVHLLLVEWLSARLGMRVVTELPADLTGELPLMQVAVFGGYTVNPAMETVNVDIDVYVPPTADGAADPATASDLAELVRSAVLYGLPGYTTPDGKATVNGAQNIARPTPRPHDQTAVRRYGASYRLFVQSWD